MCFLTFPDVLCPGLSRRWRHCKSACCTSCRGCGGPFLHPAHLPFMTASLATSPALPNCNRTRRSRDERLTGRMRVDGGETSVTASVGKLWVTGASGAGEGIKGRQSRAASGMGRGGLRRSLIQVPINYPFINLLVYPSKSLGESIRPSVHRSISPV